VQEAGRQRRRFDGLCCARAKRKIPKCLGTKNYSFLQLHFAGGNPCNLLFHATPVMSAAQRKSALCWWWCRGGESEGCGGGGGGVNSSVGLRLGSGL